MFRRIGETLLFAFAFAVVGAASSADASRPITVVEANVSPQLEAMHAGFVEWIRLQLGSAGATQHAGLVIRRAVARSDVEHPRTRDLIALAKRLGSDRALLVDLRLKDGEVEAVFRVHSVGDGKLVAAQRAVVKPAHLAGASAERLASLLPELGLEAAPAPPPANVPLSDFSVMSRALAHFDAGRASVRCSTARSCSA